MSVMISITNQMAHPTFIVLTCLFVASVSEDKFNNLEDVRIYSEESHNSQERGRFSVDVLSVTTSSIHVNWSLPEMMFKDGVLESSRVACETSRGSIVSKKHLPSRAYRCDNLYANTSYFVCVYMMETSQSSNSKVLHYSCHNLKTLEYPVSNNSLRTDSIVAVVFTLGYIIAMIIIGYATWRWKRRMKEQDEAKQKFAIEDEDYEEGDGMLNGGHRENIHSRESGGSGGRGGKVLGGLHGPGGYNTSVEDVGSRKDRDSVRGSNHGLSNSDRISSGSRGNNAGSVAFCQKDVVLERKPNSAEEVNGCLELKRNSRGSAPKLTDLAENGNAVEKKRPKSQSVEESPVKVTEISF